MLKYGPKSWKATIYVLEDLDRSLLGRIACQKLGVIAKVDETGEDPWSHIEDTPKSIHGTGWYAQRI